MTGGLPSPHRLCTVPCAASLRGVTGVRACWLGAQVRYAAVRRQTAAHAGEREVQVLDYQNTAADLLPLLASAYALVFMVAHHFCSCSLASWKQGLLSSLLAQTHLPRTQRVATQGGCGLMWRARMQGKAGMDMYREFEQDRDKGNFDKLPELHAVLSGMKASASPSIWRAMISARMRGFRLRSWGTCAEAACCRARRP